MYYLVLGICILFIVGFCLIYALKTWVCIKNNIETLRIALGLFCISQMHITWCWFHVALWTLLTLCIIFFLHFINFGMWSSVFAAFAFHIVYILFVVAAIYQLCIVLDFRGFFFHLIWTKSSCSFFVVYLGLIFFCVQN